MPHNCRGSPRVPTEKTADDGGRDGAAVRAAAAAAAEPGGQPGAAPVGAAAAVCALGPTVVGGRGGRGRVGHRIAMSSATQAGSGCGGLGLVMRRSSRSWSR